MGDNCSTIGESVLEKDMNKKLFEWIQFHKEQIKRFLPMKLIRYVRHKYVYSKIQRFQWEFDYGKYQEKELGINLIGDIRAEIGLGQSMRLLAAEFAESKLPFGIYNVDMPGNIRKNDHSCDHWITNKYPFRINVFSINQESVQHVFLRMDKKIWRNRYNIAFWLWELENFPEEHIPVIHLFDEIWTPSEFTSSSIRKVTDKPVHTLPYCVQAKEDCVKYDRKYFGLPEDQFLYLIMYDSNSTMERKNPIGSIEAFKKAYSEEDKRVGLVIKMNNPNQEQFDIVKNCLQGYGNIYYVTEILEKVQVNSLIANVDVFISLHRAEGFGLVMAEAMILGTACVATNWSSNTEFMNPDVACMVGYHKVPVSPGNAIYSDRDEWADADTNEAAEYILKLYTDTAYYKKIVTNAELHMQKDHGMSVAVERLEKRVEQIEEQIAGSEKA